jgi:hypothetical protein
MNSGPVDSRGEGAHNTRTLASVAGLKMGLTVRVQYLQNLEQLDGYECPYFKARSDFHTAWSVAMAECGVTYATGVGQVLMHATSRTDQLYSCDVIPPTRS